MAEEFELKALNEKDEVIADFGSFDGFAKVSYKDGSLYKGSIV